VPAATVQTEASGKIEASLCASSGSAEHQLGWKREQTFEPETTASAKRMSWQIGGFETTPASLPAELVLGAPSSSRWMQRGLCP